MTPTHEQLIEFITWCAFEEVPPGSTYDVGCGCCGGEVNVPDHLADLVKWAADLTNSPDALDIYHATIGKASQ